MRRSQWRFPTLLLVALAAAACRQDMHDQAVIEPYEASAVFADGAGSRTPPEATIARGLLADDTGFWKGLDAEGRPVTTLPVAVSGDLLARGRSRYEAFCAPCHDRAGTGRGMIVRRGFKQPASFHEERLRLQPVGYFYSVISNGFGEMSSYAAQIKPEDRWAVVAYLRTLQWSRAARLAELPGTLRSRLEDELAASQSPAAAPETE